MKIVLHITLWVLYTTLFIGLILPLIVGVENTVIVAKIVVSIIPAWFSFVIIMLFFVTGLGLVITATFKKNKFPNFLKKLIQEPSRDIIASKHKLLFLFSQVLFIVWSIYFLATQYV
jgi:hypothetical protein